MEMKKFKILKGNFVWNFNFRIFFCLKKKDGSKLMSLILMKIILTNLTLVWLIRNVLIICRYFSMKKEHFKTNNSKEEKFRYIYPNNFLQTYLYQKLAIFSLYFYWKYFYNRIIMKCTNLGALTLITYENVKFVTFMIFFSNK